MVSDRFARMSNQQNSRVKGAAIVAFIQAGLGIFYIDWDA
jgi:hypothetical protein